MVEEMDLLAFHNRALYHLHADPDPALGRDMIDEEWDDFWYRAEQELGLQRATFFEVRHVKHARSHRHRVYQLSRPDGTIVDLNGDYRRRELVSRVTEVLTGQPITAGRHNRWVMARLRERGEHDIVDRLATAGIDTSERPSAFLSPQERQADMRRTVTKADVCRLAWQAWTRSDDPTSFEAALRDAGLRLARGTKVPVLVAADGGVHRLAQAVAAGAKLAGDVPVRAAAVQTRLAGLQLPPITQTVPVPTPDPAVMVPAIPPSTPPETRVRSTSRHHGGPPRPSAPTRHVLAAAPHSNRSRPLQAPTSSSAQPDAPRGAAETTALAGPWTMPTATVRPRNAGFSPEEIRILRSLQERMTAAGKRVAEFRRRADAEAAAAVEAKPDWRQRLRDAHAELARPAIGMVTWRHEGRARLAQLPIAYADQLRWVEVLDDGRLSVRMDGFVLVESQDRITCDKPLLEAIEPMLAYAVKMGWQPLTITGGTAEWRETARIAAVAAGFEIAEEPNSHLGDAVNAPPVSNQHAQPNAAR